MNSNLAQEDLGSLTIKDNDEKIKRTERKNNSKRINSKDNLSQRCDSEINNYNDVSLLDFLDSLPSVPNFSDDNVKINKIISQNEECYNTKYSNMNSSVGNLRENNSEGCNSSHQNFESNHSNYSDSWNSGYCLDAWKNVPNTKINRNNWYNNLNFCNSSQNSFNPITPSPSPSNLCSTPPYTVPAEYPCQCLHYHVPTKNRSTTNILSLDSIVPSWIWNSNYHQHDHSKRECNQTTEYHKCRPTQFVPMHDNKNSNTLEIRPATVDRLLEESPNCIEAMLHPSELFCSESVPRNISCHSGSSLQSQGEVENFSGFYSFHEQHNNTFSNWPPTSNHLSLEAPFLQDSIKSNGNNLGEFDK